MPAIALIESYQDELTEIRRDLHAHPEIGFEETRTAGIVAKTLRDWGVDEVHEGIAGTGIVGIIHGKQPGERRIGLRADMDALPITETTNLPYSSRNPGRMHACGHDGHTTILLGTARYLAATRNFAGTAVLIFQPAEEGLGGARRMIAEGLFERFPCDELYGLHNDPNTPPGRILGKPARHGRGELLRHRHRGDGQPCGHAAPVARSDRDRDTARAAIADHRLAQHAAPAPPSALGHAAPCRRGL